MAANKCQVDSCELLSESVNLVNRRRFGLSCLAVDMCKFLSKYVHDAKEASFKLSYVREVFISKFTDHQCSDLPVYSFRSKFLSPVCQETVTSFVSKFIDGVCLTENFIAKFMDYLCVQTDNPMTKFIDHVVIPDTTFVTETRFDNYICAEVPQGTIITINSRFTDHYCQVV